MITCFKGSVTVKGDNLSVMSEYICITRTLIDLIKNADMTKQVSDGKKIACHLMACIGTAIEGSKLCNRKDFYEAIEMIAKDEKEESA